MSNNEPFMLIEPGNIYLIIRYINPQDVRKYSYLLHLVGSRDYYHSCSFFTLPKEQKTYNSMSDIHMRFNGIRADISNSNESEWAELYYDSDYQFRSQPVKPCPSIIVPRLAKKYGTDLNYYYRFFKHYLFPSLALQDFGGKLELYIWQTRGKMFA